MRSSHFVICCFTVLLCALMGGSPLRGQASNADGKTIFSRNCAACHGIDGRGGERAPSIATRRDIVAMTNEELTRIVHNGVAGTAMPPFGYMGDAKIQSVIHYLRTLQGVSGVAVKAPGDAHQGEALFYGKAACANCHTVKGQGGFMASSLDGFATGRPLDAIRAAILNPNSNPDRRAQEVTVITNDSKRYSGLIRNEDNFSVSLQSEDGAFHSFPRSRILRVEYSGHSLMPDDYEKKLSSKEIDDLVSFLLQAGPSEKAPGSGRHRGN